MDAAAARRAVVYGLGITGQAVAHALARHGYIVALADDADRSSMQSTAVELGAPAVVAPDDDGIASLLDQADVLVPSPGVPEHHRVVQAALARGLAVASELDLAWTWEHEAARGSGRPPRRFLAITGTDGKTTVTTMVAAMLEVAGRRAAAVGNTAIPLVAALDTPVEVFVVEASSFRLRFCEVFAPHVATWLNLAPDHLDWHATVEDYAAAKARIFEHQAANDIAVANGDDLAVMAGLRNVRARPITFGLSHRADYRLENGQLKAPGGVVLADVAQLPRALPHDIANGLAAAATALEGGASVDAVTRVLATFHQLPHRVSLVADVDGVRWYDDSKATAPHATAAAIAGFQSVVLIAGGRNKGLDLSTLAESADRLRSVVAIGEAAPDVVAAFTGKVPVVAATSMDDAVAAARRAAEPGDAVLLSPACASFDWYDNYGQRGDDFVRAVRDLVGEPSR